MFSSLTDPALITCLENGGVVVIPTDTLYGIVARAADQAAVERVYTVRGRAPQKPCIVLAADRAQIIDTSLWENAHKKLASEYWPGPLSLIAPTAQTPEYLHRGTHTLAYRIPARDDLRTLLSRAGMLIAPSANPEGRPPATTIAEAMNYFGDRVDGYVDGGKMTGESSTVAKAVGGKTVVLRQGVLKIAD